MTEPTNLRFAKYEGLGNDFLIVDAPNEALLAAGQVAKLCDRHFGVGGDGVLLVTPPTSLGARATMVVLNADGSRPEMCGNGLRCVALHLALQDRAQAVSFIVDTDAGPRLVAVERTDKSGSISVGMGRGLPEGELEQPFGAAKLTFSRDSIRGWPSEWGGMLFLSSSVGSTTRAGSYAMITSGWLRSGSTSFSPAVMPSAAPARLSRIRNGGAGVAENGNAASLSARVGGRPTVTDFIMA